MLYGIQTGFGSPQVPVAELLARPVPTLLSPQNQRQKSSNFLQVRIPTLDHANECINVTGKLNIDCRCPTWRPRVPKVCPPRRW